MDINIKVIDGVRQFPSLYDNKSNLDERSQAWMQLAEKLSMQEAYLKIRWHCLLYAYQRNNNFIYTKNMNFIKRNAEKRNTEDSSPEFIITEQDLTDDGPGDEEEFVFIELDEEEQHTAKSGSQETAIEKQSKNMHSPEKNETTEKNFKTKHDTTESTKIVQSELKHGGETSTPKREDMSITLVVEEKITAVNVNKNDEVSIVDSKKIAADRLQPLPTERCEDVIFAELVSAMLKRMDEKKKNNIKKEIMNLLFS